jgi:hypothetical protein
MPANEPTQIRPYYEKMGRVEERLEALELKGGDGGGTSGPMEGRVSRLEAFMEESRADSREIRSDLKAIIGSLGKMPTRSDLDTWRWQWMAIGLAIVALTVGGITGGLALIAG